MLYQGQKFFGAAMEFAKMYCMFAEALVKYMWFDIADRRVQNHSAPS